MEDLVALEKAEPSISLSQRMKHLIRCDRGHSIVYSTTSIPSPVQASETFKKLFEFKEDDESDTSRASSYDEKKVKKIEFSDTIKHNGDEKDMPFTYSEVDKLVFGVGS